MPRTLVTSVKYLKSEEMPEICLLSGRTDSVRERKFEIGGLSPWLICGVILCLPLGLLAVAIMRRNRETVTVPLANGAESTRTWKHHAWFAPLYVVLTLGWIVGRIMADVDANYGWEIFFGVLVVGLVIGVAIAAVGAAAFPKDNVIFKLGPDDGDVTIQFPDRLSEVADAYEAGFHKFQARRPRRRASKNHDEAEVDDWTEDVGANWDNSKPK